jgi:predicted amidohydrolase
MQLTARSVERLSSREDVTAQITTHIADVEAQIRSAAIFIGQYGGAPVKLAVLPEYLFTSYPGRISIPDFAMLAAFAPNGREYEALGKMARR